MNNLETVCIHAIVSGKVQGVFYRDTTQKKAKTLGITGWVKNTEDGHVEVIACGNRVALTQFIEWLWQGPARAKVNNVTWKEIPRETHTVFSIQ